MIFRETPLAGAFVVEIEPIRDERGFFARSWCQDEFEAHGLDSRLVQCNITWSEKKGTLRGMHYQTAPHAEVKLVRCSRGAIFDVIVDLRPESPTFKGWFGVELNQENRTMLYVPAGFAHGFQTLTDDTELFYQMSETYHPASAASVRWNDPAFGIEWPHDTRTISRRDQEIPNFLP